MPRPSLRVLSLLAAIALAVSACGDDDDDAASDRSASADGGGGEVDPTQTDDAAADTDEWPPPGRGFLPGTGDAGTVTVDGTEYAIDVIRECDVTDFFAGDNRTAVRWVQGYGLEDPDSDFSDNAEISVYIYDHTNPVSVHHALKWNGPEGIGDGSVRDDHEDALDFGDDRITGGMTTNRGDVEIDLAVPTAGPQECSS